jgi:hypothetical protein
MPARTSQLALALADDAFPAEWDVLRAPMLAACLAQPPAISGDAVSASRPGAAYSRATGLTLAPEDAALRSLAARLAHQADLRAPAMPFHAVAWPEVEPESIATTVAGARDLDRANLLASFAIAIGPELVDDAVPVLEAVLADGPDVGIDLVPARTPHELLVPGVLALAPFRLAGGRRCRGCRRAGAGRPLPDPFARAADPGRWETLPVAS